MPEGAERGRRAPTNARPGRARDRPDINEMSPPSGVTPATERWKSDAGHQPPAGPPSRTSLAAAVEIRQHGPALRPLAMPPGWCAIRRAGITSGTCDTARAIRALGGRKLGNRPRKFLSCRSATAKRWVINSALAPAFRPTRQHADRSRLTASSVSSTAPGRGR